MKAKLSHHFQINVLCLTLLYLFLGVGIVLFYPITSNIDFIIDWKLIEPIEYNLAHFSKDLYGLIGAYLLTYLVNKDKNIYYNIVVKLLRGYILTDIFMLITHNNNYSLYSYIFNMSFIIGSIYFTYKKLKQSGDI